MHLPALRALAGSRLEIVCDTNRDRLAQVVADWPDVNALTDPDVFVDRSKGLDVVIVATPGFTHYALVRALIDRGVNVFVEKPLALRLDECLDLQRRAETAAVTVCVGQTWRYRDPVLRAREALANGLIGQVYQVNVTHHASSLFHASEPPWSWEEKRHRTLLYEHGVHLVDLQVLFGGPVRTVTGLTVVTDPNLQATTRIHALAEHWDGVTGITDIQSFSSSNFTRVEVYGSANDVEIKFFPHGFRLYSGRLNPLDELSDSARRLWDYGWPLLRDRLRRPPVPARVLPHYRLLSAFATSLEEGGAPPVGIADVIPTMAYLEELARVAYA